MKALPLESAMSCSSASRKTRIQTSSFVLSARTWRFITSVCETFLQCRTRRYVILRRCTVNLLLVDAYRKRRQTDLLALNGLVLNLNHLLPDHELIFFYSIAESFGHLLCILIVHTFTMSNIHAWFRHPKRACHVISHQRRKQRRVAHNFAPPASSHTSPKTQTSKPTHLHFHINTRTQTNLKVREHKVLGPYVEGLRSFATKDFGAMNALILEGIKSRMTAATAMNDQSSRSHAVFNIQLTASTFDTMSGNTGEKTSRISLVDLAGSERVRCMVPCSLISIAKFSVSLHAVLFLLVERLNLAVISWNAAFCVNFSDQPCTRRVKVI